MAETILDKPVQTLNEIELFAFETKIRKDIMDLIRPSIEQSKELQSHLRHENDYVKLKISEFEKTLVSLNKNSILKEFNDQILDYTMESAKKEEHLKHLFSNTSEEIVNIKLDIKRCRTENENTIEHIKKLTDHLNTVHESIIAKIPQIDFQNQILEEERLASDKKKQALPPTIRMDCTDCKAILAESQDRLDKYSSMFREYKVKVDSLFENSIREDKFDNEMSELKDTITQVRYAMKDLNFNMVAMDTEIKEISRLKNKYRHSMAKRMVNNLDKPAKDIENEDDIIQSETMKFEKIEKMNSFTLSHKQSEKPQNVKPNLTSANSLDNVSSKRPEQEGVLSKETRRSMLGMGDLVSFEDLDFDVAKEIKFSTHQINKIEDRLEQLYEEINFWKQENNNFSKKLVNEANQNCESKNLETISQIKTTQGELNEFIMQQNKEKIEFTRDIKILESKLEELEYFQQSHKTLLAETIKNVETLETKDPKRDSVSSNQFRGPSRNTKNKFQTLEFSPHNFSTVTQSIKSSQHKKQTSENLNQTLTKRSKKAPNINTSGGFRIMTKINHRRNFSDGTNMLKSKNMANILSQMPKM
ncbi:unnamed protein product [Moneuplotes crassus]|uniref:Uncharacterized protein n=1 Tax=Euplotes crassus TaxID=5936 RepID=A0AAD1X0Q2_EUPCR|nr:unnamed protein product [Moneuplotes crassus]